MDSLHKSRSFVLGQAVDVAYCSLCQAVDKLGAPWELTNVAGYSREAGMCSKMNRVIELALLCGRQAIH